MASFRPLIRGFFFYLKQFYTIDGNTVLFPSPHSGILFLYCERRRRNIRCGFGFRPLIRGFFFYTGSG